MQKWECQHKECEAVAIGCGGAVGLQAIGWFFIPGMAGTQEPFSRFTLLCPMHRPDGVDGQKQANQLQSDIKAFTNYENVNKNNAMNKELKKEMLRYFKLSRAEKNKEKVMLQGAITLYTTFIKEIEASMEST